MVRPEGFGRTIANFGYHVSAAWYLDILQGLYGHDAPSCVEARCFAHGETGASRGLGADGVVGGEVARGVVRADAAHLAGAGDRGDDIVGGGERAVRVEASPKHPLVRRERRGSRIEDRAGRDRLRVSGGLLCEPIELSIADVPEVRSAEQGENIANGGRFHAKHTSYVKRTSQR